MAKQQVSLSKGREPLQITVPADFQGARTSKDSEIFLYPGNNAKFLTLEEVALCREFVAKLPYPQEVVIGATIIDNDDPLLEYDHDTLDRVEQRAALPNSRQVKGGGERSLYERVLIIRESGYWMTEQPVLSAA